MKKLIVILCFLSFNLFAELIAHRGVHQNYTRENLNNETCTATRILKPTHPFLENTVSSIEEAFHHYADIVELDIHPTTEESGPDELVVFHDWTINCRTEASCESGCNCNDKNECETNKQSLAFLQNLDIGYGYTFDGGGHFPFRGKFAGQMPSFQDVIKLLQKYPSKKILVNVKGNKLRTVQAFIRIIRPYNLDIRKRFFYPYRYGHAKELKDLGVEDEIIQGDKKCIFKYLKVGWLGIFPEECQHKKIMVPIRETLERIIGRTGRSIKFTSILWGWPEKFIALAHQHDTKIYASQVDSINEFQKMKQLDLDGIMTNKIEVVGPYSAGLKRSYR